MEEKKKSPIGKIILVLVLMVACLCGGYYLSAGNIINIGKDKEVKETKKDEVKCTEEKQNMTVYSAVDPKISGLIDNLLSGYRPGCGSIVKFANDKKITVDNIDNQAAYLIAEVKMFSGENPKKSFTLDEFTSTIKEYLGKDYKFDPEKVDYKGEGCPQYNYDKATKTFNKQETACGWTCGPASTYRIVKAIEEDGILKLDTKVIYSSNDAGKEGYYSDYQKAKFLGTFDHDVNYMLNEGSDYQFTYKLEDGNYVFVSSEPMNK